MRRRLVGWLPWPVVLEQIPDRRHVGLGFRQL
jgi:hypothetical protein